MENLSAKAITSLSNYANNANFSTQPGVKDKTSFNISNSLPSKEKIDHLNKIGQEYPFCVFHKHRNNDPL
jgi:hypothetical protein